MHPDLVKLLDLQAKDLALIEVDARLDAVLAEVEELDAQLARIAKESEAAWVAAREGERRRDEMEAKIETYRKLQEQRKKRIEFVRGSKEAASLMADLDLARSVLAQEESEWVRFADSVHQLKVAAEQAEARIGETRAAQAPERQRLEEKREQIEAERELALGARETSATSIEKSLRTRYDRLRSSKPLSVVVPLVGPACSACYTTVPLNRRSLLRSSAGFDWCEACGVILYIPDPTD
jgi:predicted  nucleic acid-binding Zn-ribbon protein